MSKLHAVRVVLAIAPFVVGTSVPVRSRHFSAVLHNGHKAQRF
ncbi:hypothetical protein [Microseira sp. BLCC-F43]